MFLKKLHLGSLLVLVFFLFKEAGNTSFPEMLHPQDKMKKLASGHGEYTMIEEKDRTADRAVRDG